jgi:hypothetical protein
MHPPCAALFFVAFDVLLVFQLRVLLLVLDLGFGF